MNSLRAKGVMSIHAASAVAFVSSAARRSAGSLCTTPPGTRLLVVMSVSSPALTTAEQRAGGRLVDFVPDAGDRNLLGRARGGLRALALDRQLEGAKPKRAGVLRSFVGNGPAVIDDDGRGVFHGRRGRRHGERPVEQDPVLFASR